MPLEPPVLQTERVIVRMARPDDAGAISRYFLANREHLAASRPLMGEEFYTETFWFAQARAHAAEFRDRRSVRLFLFDRAAPARVIGNANFTQIFQSPSFSCVLGYGLDHEYEGRGIMREALEACLPYMFRTHGLHRITANYVPRNDRSGGLLRRLGFVVEGFARDYLLLNGRWEDHVLTSLTNAEWTPGGTAVR